MDHHSQARGDLDSPMSSITLPALLVQILVGVLVLVATYFLRNVKPVEHGSNGKTTASRELHIEPLRDFDYKTIKRAKHRHLKPIYHITMGLRNSSPSELVTIDEDYLDRVNLRRQLVAAKGRGVHGVVPHSGGADAVRELYAYLMNLLPRRYPTIFTANDDEVYNAITGKSFPTTIPAGDEAAERGLRALAETIEEDLFLLKQQGDEHVCVAFMCAFPSGFDPASKLGLGLEGIHGPVPSYEKIGPSMERFFAKLEYGKPVCRYNWSVQTHGELHNLAGNHITTEGEVVEEPVDISQTYFRVEFQTLTRLPETRALLFSFKTYLHSLAEIKAEGRGPELADAIEGLSKGNAPGMWRYKAAVRWGPKAIEYLRS